MKRKGLAELSGINIEGGALSSSVLHALMARKLEHTDAASYHLEEGYTTGEKIAEDWNRTRTSWKAFTRERARLGTEPGAGVTRDKFLLPLFERLGYGRLAYSGGLEASGERYAITHRWGDVPIHLVGADTDLDSRTSGVAGAARRSPHGLVLEYLNRGTANPWGFASNGRRLRLLRENRSIVRQSYIEFDLEGILEGESYADFTALWMLCHQSRLEGTGEAHILESWREAGIKEGERALDELRLGMEKTISALGSGLVAHPANTALRDALRKGKAQGGLDAEEFYHELLRLAYRLIFLFVAEDRDVLLDPLALVEARKRYAEHYSTRRLRELARSIRGGGHGDLWQGLVILMDLLAESGCADLGLPALGSFLWERESIAHLAGCALANRDLLGAVRNLAFTLRGGALWPTDFRNLGSEELGSVYESLLELHSELNLEGGSFALATAAGHERKTTGSYYTPTELVERLLDEALDPVIEARLREVREIVNKGVGSREIVNKGVGSREIVNKGVGSREIGGRKDGRGGSFVSGSESLATRDEARGGVLPDNHGISEGGNVRDDFSNQKGRNVNSSQHSGGLGTSEYEGVYPLPSDRPGKPQGTGNASPAFSTGGSNPGGKSLHSTTGSDRSREDDTLPYWFFTAQASVGRHTPIPYSLLAEHALLSMKVCDPAMGSGHFLAGAARRLAKALASARTGDPEPGPAPLRHALADVVQNCIYGVDLNPLAVELCKISLWMEALEPGRPLSFLDHHLKCGNSLVGATRELMAKGIPEGAFTELTGDDKTTVRAAKKRNNDYKGYSGGLFTNNELLFPDYAALAENFSRLSGIDETTLEGVRLLATRYRGLLESSEYIAELSAANGWCAAFFQPKRPGAPEPITQEHFATWLRDPSRVSRAMKASAEKLSAQAGFFHWELAFPEVFRPAGGKPGGFDVVLGNPPWDQVQLDPGEYFSMKHPAISAAPNMAAKERMIEKLKKEEPGLYAEYITDLNNVEALQSFVHGSGRYPLTSYGRLNLAPLFAEHARMLVSPSGRIGIIIPSGIATDSFNQFFFQDLVKKRTIVSLYDFENQGIFPGVHNSYKFCMLTLSGDDLGKDWKSRFVFFAHSVQDLEESDRQIELSEEDFERINPNTLTCPIFRNRRDAELTKAISRRVPAMVIEKKGDAGNPWIFNGLLMFMMNTASNLFKTARELESNGLRIITNKYVRGNESWLPLIEAKMVSFYDHRVADVIKKDGNVGRQQQPEYISDNEKKNPNRESQPYYWIKNEEVDKRLEGRWSKDWLIGWRDITSTTNERTLIVGLLPRSGVGNKLPIVITGIVELAYCLYANLASYVLDYCARQKIGGVTFNFFYFKQLPVLPPSVYTDICSWTNGGDTLADWIKPRVLELVYTSHSLEPFARDLGYTGTPFAWDVERRFALRCELDAAFFHLYGMDRDDAGYILDTFPIVKRRDEQEFGEYRTKRVILERYDEYAEVIKKNKAGGSGFGVPEDTIPEGLYPAVPALLTMAGLVEYLSQLGVQVDNNRAAGGSMWVYQSKAEFGKLAEHLQKSGVDVRFYPDGRKKRAGEQWELDVGKRLG